MPDNVEDIRAFYDANVDREHDRLTRHPIEHDVTWRYLDAYLPAKGTILDIGCATGAYTIPMARRGYHVTAVESISKSGSRMRKASQRIRSWRQSQLHCR